MKFCGQCGGPTVAKIPSGDNRERDCCEACGAIFYRNPKIVAGTVPVYQDSQILLCKRAIEPRYGLWTLPAGFLEEGETLQEGALRETVEESRVGVDIEKLYTVFNLPHISQVYMFFLGRLEDLNFGPTEETLEVRLLAEDEIPWDELAFPVIKRTLKHFFADLHAGENRFPMRIEDITYPR
ncbi:MAG: NUDIX hydrolase [Gammaproteobacteria bacterium AqS3]|nr:NUDIX hydrolase [Gammaproteobacteria bacterium AqS3]